MTIVTAPLVGAHFRPPAKAILAGLPAGCPLEVVPEPDNAYDANALQVFVRSGDIPASQHEELDNSGRLFGFPLEDILAQEKWHLGYIARARAEELVGQINEQLGLYATHTEDVKDFMPATLAFDASGKPTVQMDLPG